MTSRTSPLHEILMTRLALIAHGTGARAKAVDSQQAAPHDGLLWQDNSLARRPRDRAGFPHATELAPVHVRNELDAERKTALVGELGLG